MMVHVMRSNSPTTPATTAKAATAAAAKVDRDEVASASPPEQLIESIVGELRGSLRELRCGTMERILGLNVSMTQMHVLWLLEHQGEVPVSRLAELLGVSVSNSTGLIDRMEDRELVARRRAPGDRRVVLVQLGPAGTRVLRDLESLHHERLRRALAHLDPERLSGVLNAFAEFRSAIEADLGPQTYAHTQHAHTHMIDPAGRPAPSATHGSRPPASRA
jgi:DNA-binding MarR family transcriptional regulator